MHAEVTQQNVVTCSDYRWASLGRMQTNHDSDFHLKSFWDKAKNKEKKDVRKQLSTLSSSGTQFPVRKISQHVCRVCLSGSVLPIHIEFPALLLRGEGEHTGPY
jgi:hypothetical protein